jgi:hypothetical protein
MVSVPQVVGENENRLAGHTLGTRATSTRAYGLLEDLELISEVLAIAGGAGGEAVGLVGNGNVDAALVLHDWQRGTLDSELCGRDWGQVSALCVAV